MKQKTKCKIKTVLYSIVFILSMSFLKSTFDLIFYDKNFSHVPFMIVFMFAVYQSSFRAFKNAFAAGWIEFVEEQKSGKS